ncbi:MAG TPA: APC family permease [Pseudonocardia sp.]|jgi:amino acid transporter
MAGLDRRNLAPPQVFAQSVSGAAPAAAMAVTPAIVAAQAGSATIWSFAVATVLALLIASCIGQFTSRMAAAGSLYSLTAKGLGSVPAFLCGSGLLIGYGLLTMSALVGAAMHLGGLAGLLGMPKIGGTVGVLVALLVLAAVVATCLVRGVRVAASVVLLVEAVSIGLMLVVFGTLLVKHRTLLDTHQLLPGRLDLGAVIAGVLPALAAFIGFEAAAALGVEARRPFRTIPRAVRGTAALTGVLSLSAGYTQVASFSGVPGGLAAQPDPVPTLAMAEQLPWLSVLLTAGLATSFFACSVATSTALVRLLLSAGRERVLPAALGRTHRRFRTPHVAVAVALPVVALVPVGLIGIGMAPSRVLVVLLTTATLGYLLAYLLVCLAAPVFLHRIGELTVLPVVTASIIVPVLLMVLIAYVAAGPAGVALIVVGAVLVMSAARYLWLRARNPNRVAAIGLYDETSVADVFGAPSRPRR